LSWAKRENINDEEIDEEQPMDNIEANQGQENNNNNNENNNDSINSKDKSSQNNDNNNNNNKNDDDDEKCCIICMDQPIEYVCIPCGHHCLCSNCKTAIEESKECPYCR